MIKIRHYILTGISLFLFSLVSQAQFLRKDNVDRFKLFLDNGIERVDLSKTQTCNKSFFSKGQPRLVIEKKTESRLQLNLVIAYKVFLYEDIMGKPPGFFSMKSSFFSMESIKQILAAPSHSQIMLGDIELDIPDKTMNPQQQKTAAFYINIE